MKMKKFIYISVISFLIISCGGGDDSVNAIENVAPTTPTLIAPVNNKLCVDNSLNFEWSVSVDSNNDPIIYEIQVAKDNQFVQIVKTLKSTTNSQNIVLEKGVAYYWRVKATDDKFLSRNYSEVYKFYTQGEAVINHLPFSPELVQPVLNALLNTTTATLSWNATDVDITDSLSYDIYFGTNNPLTSKVSANQTTKTLEVNLVASTVYYWKVVVKDDKGGETIGQTWMFKTN
jgi:hypothetical protein